MSELNKKLTKMKNFEVKNLFEFLNKIASERGVSKDLTHCILTNITELNATYNEILSGIFNPDTDKNVQEYKQEIQKLQLQFADKNEAGEIIAPNGKIQLTEHYAEYEAAIKALNEKYTQVLQMLNNAPAYNNQYMNNERDITLYTMDEYPDETQPLLVYFLTK